MDFISVSFVVLYLVALALRALSAARDRRLYVVGLLLLSWVFYGWHVPAYLALLLLSTGVDYVAARAIAAAPAASAGRRRAWLAASLAVNLGLLGYFKYGGFLAANLAAVLGESAGSAWRVILPVGISFYTFQSMSYTIDVYRGVVRAEPSFARFACYVAFFPQLVAGPIVRAGDFLYQLGRYRPLRLRVLGEGAYLIVRGLFLKMVVADNLGRVVDSHWAEAAAGAGDGWVAFSLLVFFACQLFCDFAGYTDIARGVAYHLGFRLPINFDAPYLATTFSDFWRRWHISLSTWFRDYVYVPLGGNRRGGARTALNLLLVMLAAGLWHGANWTFVLWGALHGVAVAGERMLGLARGPRGRAAAALWYLVVQLSWILSMALFRAADISEARGILTCATGAACGANGGAAAVPGDVVAGWWLVLPVVALHLRSWIGERSGARLHPYERALYAGAMSAAILTLYTTSRQFIYFQF